MKKYDVIIIGAGPAGVVTGLTVKKQNSSKSVLIITEEEKGLIPCGIPYIFHQLGSVEKNMMGLKPFKDLGGEVIVDPVNEVNIKEKSVGLKSGNIYHYDKLVFATGSRPVKAKFIRGYDLKNVFYIEKSYSYIHRLFEELKSKKNIVIIGGGFIGAEMAEQLSSHHDKHITLIESQKYCFSKAFSEELSKIATGQLNKTAINIRTSTLAEEIVGNNKGSVEKVVLKNGEEIAADAVIISIGYKPNSELAEKAGLPLNMMGAIKVDSYERTSEKDVSAVGDCSQTIGFLTGRSDQIMLASTATAEARVLGYNLFGVKIKKLFSGTLGIFSTKINELAMAAAGIDER
ncbi:MAG: FAD-dependent oxidoreductase, partial [Bacteroidales bacterium]|nr:FAD-dependent oxidoreductase [Bacteroidales bacterium]